MFPEDENKRSWSMKEIDDMDSHFFDELMEFNPEENPQPKENDVYLSDVL